jgi:multidrug resistance efflux pump
MNPLPVIPTPLAQRWREFRLRVLPILTFLGVLLVLTVMWRQYVTPPTLVGQVEPITAYVTSLKPGTLAQLNLARMQRVKAGDPVAQVITTDPKVLTSSLAVIQAEIQLLRVNLQPIIDQQRYAINYDRIRLDWLSQRVDLATTRVKLQLAENDLRRTSELFKDKIVSEKVFDRMKTARDALQAEIEERTKLAAELEQNLQSLRLRNDSTESVQTPPSPEDVLQASIAVQEEKLRLTEAELSPLTLRAPMDGIVSVLNHRTGEAITAGEPVVTLSALSADRIVGYIRQPIIVEPAIGMSVEIRARSLKRGIGRGKVLRVGTQMEQIDPALLPPSNFRTPVFGLPVLVSLPPELKLLSGEIVDLTIK